MIKTCDVGGCDRKYSCNGFCAMHDVRMRKNGHTDLIVRICDVDGCGKKHKNRGFCSDHYKLLYVVTAAEKAQRTLKRKRYYEKNKDKLAALAKTPRAKELRSRYSLKNKDAISAQRKDFYHKNSERLKEKSASYYEENKEKLIEKVNKWGKENPEKVHAYKSKHKKSAIKSLSDTYVKDRIRASFGVKNPPQELVELKRVQLKIHRLINRGN